MKFQISNLKFQILVFTIHYSLFTVSIAFSASEGGHEGGSDLIWRVINFAVLAGLLYFLLAKKLKGFLRDRSESIKTALSEAKAAKEEAERKYREYEAMAALLDRKIVEIADELRAEGIAERDRIIEEAKKTAEKMMEQAKTTIEQEIKKAREGIRGEVANLAVIMAGEMLKREIKPDDQERLIREYLDRMRLH